MRFISHVIYRLCVSITFWFLQSWYFRAVAKGMLKAYYYGDALLYIIVTPLLLHLVRMCVGMCVCVRVCVCTCMCVSVCVCVCMCMHVCMCLYVHVHAFVCACMSVCMCACVRVYPCGCVCYVLLCLSSSLIMVCLCHCVWNAFIVLASLFVYSLFWSLTM